MTRISKPKRSRSGSKRLDLTDMRELFRDRRVWTAIGVVTAPDDGGAHWQVETDDGGAVDVTVEVVLHPSETPVTCRLRGGGWWEVPALGDEVAVLVPEGAIDFMPLIVARLSSNTVPTTQGPDPSRVVIVAPSGGEVVIHDGEGGAEAVALKSDVQDLRDFIATEMIIVTPSGNSTPGVLPAPAGVDPPDPAGTEVLKAK